MYEYRTKFFRSNDEQIDTRVNAVAREGWRIVSVTHESKTSDIRVMFEREVRVRGQRVPA